MLEAVEYLNGTERCPKLFGVKLQLLHVLKGTDLEKDYLDGKFQVLTENEYVDVVIQCIRHLDPDIVLHRVTGDGPKALLTAPLWSGNKKQVLNHLHREMKARGARQGDFFNVIQDELKFVILTTAANSSMISVHDRMPLILEQGEVSDWICNVDAARRYLNKVPLALKQEREYEQQSLFEL